jgi:hypothetical protein
MYWSFHIFQGEAKLISAALTEIAAMRGLKPATIHDEKSVWKGIILSDSVEWVSVFDNQSGRLKGTCQDLSGHTGLPVLAIRIDLPYEWGFFAASGGAIAARYLWSIPEEFMGTEASVHDLEKQKLESLGVKIPGILIGGKRIASSDPHVELHYRKKLSQDLAPPPPELVPELPKIMSKLFPERPAARFRKILGESHLTVEAMAAEFTSCMEITHAFDSYETLKQTPADSHLRDAGGLFFQFG